MMGSSVDEMRSRNVTLRQFSAVSVMCALLKVRKRGQRESLIRTRESFVRELLKSVEAL